MKRFHILCIFFVALVLVACSDNDEPVSHIPNTAVYDFVTLDSSSSEGSEFSMQKNGDSPLIYYSSNIDFSKVQTIKDGDRLIICYNRTDGPTYSSGEIKIYGYVFLASTQQQMIVSSPNEYNDWKCSPLKPTALWRTGQYINIEAQLMVYRANKPESFVIVADEATLGDPYPELHLYYENQKDNDGLNSYSVFGSFDISQVWSSPSCHGVKIIYPSTSGFESSTFYKY